MTIAIDAREAFRTQKTGKGVWTGGLIAELLARSVSCVLVTDTPIPSWARRENVAEILIPGSGFLWHMRAARTIARRSDIDWFLAPTSFIIPWLLSKKIRTAVVIHDLIAFMDEPHDRKARAIERILLPRLIKKVRCFLTVSESTKKDLLKRFPRVDAGNVHVIFAGPLSVNPTKNIPDGQTILCAATLCPRKNQRRLIQAFSALPESIRLKSKLILIGNRGWDDEEIVALARSSEGVEWKSYVPDDEYERLLNTCTVFALPSLYEGFGMQILDALQRGIPVLTSNKGSLREVAGDAALIVDPEHTEAIASGLQELLTNPALRTKLSAAGPKQAEQFSWKRTVDLLLEALMR